MGGGPQFPTILVVLVAQVSFSGTVVCRIDSTSILAAGVCTAAVGKVGSKDQDGALPEVAGSPFLVVNPDRIDATIASQRNIHAMTSIYHFQSTVFGRHLVDSC